MKFTDNSCLWPYPRIIIILSNYGIIEGIRKLRKAVNACLRELRLKKLTHFFFSLAVGLGIIEPVIESIFRWKQPAPEHGPSIQSNTTDNGAKIFSAHIQRPPQVSMEPTPRVPWHSLTVSLDMDILSILDHLMIISGLIYPPLQGLYTNIWS